MKGAPWLVSALLLFAPARAETPAPATTVGNPLDNVRLEDLRATRERPLFSPSRRPPPPPAARVEAPPPPAPPIEEKAAAIEPPPFDLVGAVVGEGVSYALLRNRTTSKVTRFRPGEDAEGWRVGVVSLRSVALERDGRKESLALAGPPATPQGDPGAEVAGEPPDDGAPAPPIAELKRMTRKPRPER